MRWTKLMCTFGVVLASMPQIGKAIAPMVAYRVTDLGVLPGADYSIANAINDLGQVTDSSGAGSGGHVFVWKPQTGMQDLGAPAGVISAAGVGINNNGQIAVSTTKEFSSPYTAHAFRWSSGTFQDLGTLGGTYSTAYGIDASGRVAGYAYTGSDIHAYRSTTGASLVDIDSLGGGYSLGYGINASGQVVGEAYNSQHEYHAFLWTGSGSMQDLGTLGSNTFSQANDISDSGIVVGESGTAFIIQNGVKTNLGSLEIGSYGVAVNDLAQVIGTVTDGQQSYPYVWDSASGMRALNNILDPATAAGWTLRDVFDINNLGQIVGQGVHNGVFTAFLLAPVPEPSTIALCATVGVLGGLRPRRRAR